MEEYGIGRPSTYAATITTITGREYVVRDGKALKPTELGEVTTKLMKERFPKIVNVKFTAQMEEDLDGIEAGKEKLGRHPGGVFTETLTRLSKRPRKR